MELIDLGLTPYRQTWELQERALLDVQAGAPERIYLTEHHAVYTLGRHGHQENLLALPPGAECIRIDRGGDITYHGPGQLVVYPIINLLAHHLGVKAYVNILEEAVIRTIAEWGVKGERCDGATGVWIEPDTPRVRKICAIGVRVSRGVTMHGLALNVSTDLRAFGAINPCGFTDRGVCSLASETGAPVPLPSVARRLAAHLISLLS